MADLNFAQYYQTELAYYRELAQEFAGQFPEVAHLVAERGGDRSVERMLQGAALLTGRLRQRIEEAYPEIICALFELLWPQYLRPVPPVTLVQFTPVEGALIDSQRIPRGTAIRSRPIGGATCWFQTTEEIHVAPVELTRAEVVRARATDLQLRVGLRATGGATFDSLRRGALRLQLRGDLEHRCTLYMCLVLHASGVTVRDLTSDRAFMLPKSCIRPVGLGEDQGLVPGRPSPLPGLHLLQEYQRFVDKLLGVTIGGLDRVPEGAIQEEFELAFHLGQISESDLRVNVTNLALGCVPAVNISPSEELTIPMDTQSHQILIQPPDEAEVFEVQRVGGNDRKTGAWVEYLPFLGGKAGDRQPYYQVIRRVDGVKGVRTYIVITDSRGRPLVPPAAMLSVWLTYTDGDRPLQLEIGSVDQPSSSSPDVATFANVTPVTPGKRLVLDTERYWRLLGHFTVSPNELHSEQGLRQLLKDIGWVGGPEIRGLTSTVSSRLYCKTVVPMRQIDIEVDREAFVCEGQLYLFASLLKRVLSPSPGSSEFVQVSVRATDGTTFRFDPAGG